MRVGTFTAGLLAGALLCVAGAGAQTNSGKVSIPMTAKAQDKPAAQKTSAKQAQPQAKPQAKSSTKARAAKRAAARKAAARRAAIRHAKRQRANFYDYASAQPVYPGGFREAWLAHRGMRNVRYAPPPPPMQYGPPPGYYDEAGIEPGIEIDRQGWTGGVGYGTSGDFVDGYGRMHYGWNNPMNGPTYNSFDQSFQHNPSVARPFQPRRMGHPIPSR